MLDLDEGFTQNGSGVPGTLIDEADTAATAVTQGDAVLGKLGKLGGKGGGQVGRQGENLRLQRLAFQFESLQSSHIPPADIHLRYLDTLADSSGASVLQMYWR